MPKSRVAATIISAGILSLMPALAFSQDYPNKTIRIITAEAGSGVDIVTRLMVSAMTATLGQQLIVDNRGGASGVTPIQAVAKAPPDGYTLLLYGTGMWTLPLLQNLPYDPVSDFSPISLTGSSPNILVVHPSLPVKSVAELIAFSKARPGALSYSSGGTGASNHLAAELFKSMAGLNILRIPYKGPASALSGMITGETQLMFPNAAAAAPHLDGGRLRALAVSTARPSALAPGLPTIAASGLPGYESAFAVGMFAPAKTPAAIVSRLHQEAVRALNSAEVKSRLFNVGVEAVGSSPEELASSMKSEMARIGRMIKDAGIRAD